jgi:hypothetical protein
MRALPRRNTSRLGRWIPVVVAAALAAVACGQPCAEFDGRVQVETPAPVEPGPEASTPAPIGVATMLDDRTIVMTLTAEGTGGARGEGRFTYRPGDRDYDAVLAHLGALAPGESVPVLPWPESGTDARP